MALAAIGCGGPAVAAPSPIPWFAPTVALPTTDPRFDPSFFGQLAHGTLEAPDAPTPLQRLQVSPSVYLQRPGLSDAFVAQIEQTLREEVPAFTGHALTLARFEAGTALRPDADGWIVIELRTDEAAACGRSKVGAAAGHIWINTAAACARRGEITGPVSLFAHELGHALGFFHVEAGLMQADVPVEQRLTEREQFHGAIVYTQPRGAR